MLRLIGRLARLPFVIESTAREQKRLRELATAADRPRSAPGQAANARTAAPDAPPPKRAADPVLERR